MTETRQFVIERLGRRGEGLAHEGGATIAIPYALAGETVLAQVDGDRGHLVEIVTPSPDRVPAFCPHYGICGGCAVQALAMPVYGEWKRGLVVAALEQARLRLPVAPLVDAHGEGRRRATFHARVVTAHGVSPRAETGFMRARAHDIIEIDACPVLAPGMNNALSAARALATVLAPLGKPLDIAVTATMAGLDVDMRGSGPLDFPQIQALIAVAGRLDLARLANHGDIVIERRLPTLAMGRARVVPPPGTFLQATQAGEETLARLVHAGIGKARRTADLFAGVGTFALRLAETTEVHGVESDAVALAALDRAAREASGLHPITVERRDLVRRPLAFGELAPFEAVVFDPPRVGAQAQAKALAASKVPRVVAVSCNAESFARDAAILTAGGYACEGVTPIDQFRHSPHVEMVGVFARPTQKGRKRGLLG